MYTHTHTQLTGHIITPQQEFFDELDANHDGVIEFEELEALLEKRLKGTAGDEEKLDTVSPCGWEKEIRPRKQELGNTTN